MTNKGRVYELDAYRKTARPLTGSEVSTFLRTAAGLPYKVSFDPDGGALVPKVHKTHNVWVTAGLNSVAVSSTGSTLLDWFNSTLSYHARYELILSVVTETPRGKRIDQSHRYLFDTPQEVKRQIEWELGRICGTGFFAFQNYTKESNELFIELNWNVSEQ